jgi:cytochrome oxidase Cu insertion factor (SCO1/SenC/PrrC family)
VKLSDLQTVLWVLAGAAAFVFIWLLMWADYRADLAQAETFPIFFERIEEATAPGGYTMGHTSHLFLFDPRAGFANSWPYGTPAEEILADLRKRI